MRDHPRRGFRSAWGSGRWRGFARPRSRDQRAAAAGPRTGWRVSGGDEELRRMVRFVPRLALRLRKRSVRALRSATGVVRMHARCGLRGDELRARMGQLQRRSVRRLRDQGGDRSKELRRLRRRVFGGASVYAPRVCKQLPCGHDAMRPIVRRYANRRSSLRRVRKRMRGACERHGNVQRRDVRDVLQERVSPMQGRVRRRERVVLRSRVQGLSCSGQRHRAVPGRNVQLHVRRRIHQKRQ